MEKKIRFHILFDKRLLLEERAIANPLKKRYEKITSGEMDESKPISMKHIVPPLPYRTQSHKRRDTDWLKSSAKTMHFVDDFPKTSLMMKPNALTLFSHLDTKKGYFYCIYTTLSINMKNPGELSEAIHTLK